MIFTGNAAREDAGWKNGNVREFLLEDDWGIGEAVR